MSNSFSIFVPYVCILTCEKHLDRLLKKYGDSAVGIYLFNSKNKILTIKEPSANYCSIEKELVFSLLRKSEYKYIIEKNHKKIPITTQVKYYSECMRVFCELDLDTIMKDTIHVLKKRFKTINELFYKVPKSLKMLVYQSNYTNSDYEKMFYFLNSKSTMLNKEAKDVLSIFKR